jgi:hypothetical protein
MAVTQKNVIEDVIISTHVDKLSPSVENMQRRTASATKQINRQFKDVGDVFRLAMGGAAGALVINQYNKLVQFAKDHNTEAGKLGIIYDKLSDDMKMTVVSSESFKKTMEGVNIIVGLIDKGVKGLSEGMDKLGLTFLDMFGGIGAGVGAYQRFKEQFFPTKKDADNSREVAKIVADDYKRIADLQAAVARGREAAERGRKQEIEDYQNSLIGIQKWVGYVESSYLGSVQHEIDMMTEREQVYKKNIDVMNQLRASVPKAADPNEKIQLRFDKQEEAINRYAELLKARVQEMRDVWLNGWVNAFVSGFQAIGQSIVEGGNVLKAFVSNFLSAIGQMAVQFGTMMILYGIAGDAIPFLGISGTAAIAAGAALVVFGGALTALAGTMNRTASGGSGNSYKPESSFDNGSQREGNTTITVILQALDPSQVSDNVMRGLGLRVGKEIQKQDYLGRSLSWSS